MVKPYPQNHGINHGTFFGTDSTLSRLKNEIESKLKLTALKRIEITKDYKILK